jgi:hypothetical protein
MPISTPTKFVKRARSLSPVSPETPPKRRRVSSAVSFNYPYLPSSPGETPYPHRPSDSPSNPFGRKRTTAIKSCLPERTSFGKHLPLRFQFFPAGTTRPDDVDVHRITQVPLNYTFAHLRCLIHFLFGGENGVKMPSPDEDEESGGHLFQVMKNVERDPLGRRIVKGLAWARLSNTDNPYLYKRDWEVDISDFEDEDEDDAAADAKPAKEEVRWEAEEDMRLESVWGGKEPRLHGIVYVCFFF